MLPGVLGPRASGRLWIRGLGRGTLQVTLEPPDGGSRPVAGAECVLDDLLELAVPLEEIGLAAGDSLDLLIQLRRNGQPIETWPEGQGPRLTVPDGSFPGTMWTV